eukprot:295823-Pelagomonas_calceolata.AAC.2
MTHSGLTKTLQASTESTYYFWALCGLYFTDHNLDAPKHASTPFVGHFSNHNSSDVAMGQGGLAYDLRFLCMIDLMWAGLGAGSLQAGLCRIVQTWSRTTDSVQAGLAQDDAGQVQAG